MRTPLLRSCAYFKFTIWSPFGITLLRWKWLDSIHKTVSKFVKQFLNNQPHIYHGHEVSKVTEVLLPIRALIVTKKLRVPYPGTFCLCAFLSGFNSPFISPFYAIKPTLWSGLELKGHLGLYHLRIGISKKFLIRPLQGRFY